jgi:hypothetical protein
MKKKNLDSLIVLGILSGSLLTGKLAGETPKKSESTTNKSTTTSAVLSTTNGNMGSHLMTEDELLIQLNDEGTKLYEALTPEGKLLALKVASSRCNGLNECAGLNACSTESNKCAGLGKCKGLGKCAISDSNLAIKFVQKKMAEKRQNAQQK